MKRTAMTLLLVAGLGGCVSPSNRQGQNNYAESRATWNDSHVQQARGSRTNGLTQAGGYDRGAIRQAAAFDNAYDPAVYGPRYTGAGMMMGRGGILPAPMQGPQGVVAGVGMIDPSMGGFGPAAMYGQQRSEIKFVAPVDMKVSMQDGRGFSTNVKETPFREHMLQGGIYRLRISGIPDRPGKVYYPTLEVYPATMKTISFLSHSSVPVGFSAEDFDQVNNGNMVVKVVYLPDEAFQDLAALQEIVSTKLDPGQDPIAEANRRGTILAVIKLGNIDLENPNTPAMDAPAMNGFGAPPAATQPSTQAPATPTDNSMPAINLPALPGTR